MTNASDKVHQINVEKHIQEIEEQFNEYGKFPTAKKIESLAKENADAFNKSIYKQQQKQDYHQLQNDETRQSVDWSGPLTQNG